MNIRRLEVVRSYRSNINFALVSYLHLSRKKDEELEVLTSEAYDFFQKKCEKYIQKGKCKALTGFEQDIFNQLLTMLRLRKKSSVPNYIRLVIFLKYAKEGVSQNVLGKTVGLSQPTICRIVSDAIRDISSHADSWIMFPKNHDEVYEIEKGFMEMNKGLRCFGIIDGKHFKIEKPEHSGSLNRNYKGFFSFNSLFVVDDRNAVIYLQITENGCNSDSQIFNSGPLLALLNDTRIIPPPRYLPGSNIIMPSFILADNGFGMHPSIMMPYRQSSLTTDRILFNSILSSVRVRVENVFGQLTSRFRVFRQSCNLSVENTRELLVSTVVIHNMIIGRREVPKPRLYVLPRHVLPYKDSEEQRNALLDYVLAVN